MVLSSQDECIRKLQEQDLNVELLEKKLEKQLDRIITVIISH